MYITVGRNPKSDIVITGYDVVSYDHATIEYLDGKFLFIDDSSNGSLVNGRFLNHESCPINEPDSILLAGVCPLRWEEIYSRVPNLPNEGRRTQIYAARNMAGAQGQPYQPQQPQQPQPYQQPQQPVQQMPPQQQLVYIAPQAPAVQQPQQPAPASNSSSKYTMTPQSLDKWNWGAFLLSWIWGIFNNVYWTLVALIPIPLVGLIVAIIAGVKGTRQSWENGHWNESNYSEFAQKQHNWAIAGLIVLLLSFVSTIILWSTIFGALTSVLS